MGCFNVAGTMSKCSISHGQKAIFIPLIASDKSRTIVSGPDKRIKPSVMLVGGSEYFYVPRFLPIIGEYDDYGSLKNIERDANVIYIEEYFGLTIDQFMDYVTDRRDKVEPPNPELAELAEELKSIGGMFEHYSVYQEMVAYAKKYEKNAYEKASLLEDHILLHLGFEYRPDIDADDERFNQILMHPDCEDFKIKSDGYWKQFIHIPTGKNLKNDVYRVQDLVDVLNELGINFITENQIDDLKSLTTVDLSLKAVLNKLKVIDQKDDQKVLLPQTLERLIASQSEESLEAEIKIYADHLKKEKKRQVLFAVRMISQFNENDLRYALYSEQLFPSFVDMYCFNYMMEQTNNHYFPAINGEQHGNYRATIALNESCLRMAKETDREVGKDAYKTHFGVINIWD